MAKRELLGLQRWVTQALTWVLNPSRQMREGLLLWKVSLSPSVTQYELEVQPRYIVTVQSMAFTCSRLLHGTLASAQC